MGSAEQAGRSELSSTKAAIKESTGQVRDCETGRLESLIGVAPKVAIWLREIYCKTRWELLR